MRKTIAAAILAGTAILGMIPVTASATTRPATPARQTCAAFTAWQRHHTAAHLDAMMTASERAPWKYLGEDAASLYADVRGGKAKYVASDERYTAEDCAKV